MTEPSCSESPSRTILAKVSYSYDFFSAEGEIILCDMS